MCTADQYQGAWTPASRRTRVGLMSPGTRGADAQGPGWVDDPGAEGVDDPRDSRRGPGGAEVPVVEDLGAVVENPAVVEDHPGVEDPEGSRPRTGTAANLM